jgi:predicted CoA-substrate-specific enzyme activase
MNAVAGLRDKRGKAVYIGIDIGSTSSDVVVLDESFNIIFSDYRRTSGRPIETVWSQLGEIFRQIESCDVVLAAATGSAGRLFAKICGIRFVNEVCAQAAAVYHLYRQFQRATIIEMGGQDSKLIFISAENGRAKIKDFSLNTVCAAGTGSFLDQQASRLGINIEKQFGRLALESKTVPRMAGRCSVFAKTDMIHLQQQATPSCDIIAGLCLALVKNLKSNLGCGREFVKPIIFTGGVAANIGVIRAMEDVFELVEGELFVPDEHFFTGAIGAVLAAKEKTGGNGNGTIGLEQLNGYLTERGCGLREAGRRGRLREPRLKPPGSPVYEHLLLSATGPIDAYIGVDVGSISTNVVVIDESRRVLAKAYLMTAGAPLEAIRKGLEMVGRKAAGKVKILGAATTGSGRYLTGDFIGADVVINEITAQAAGAAIVNPKVDTIFEIGGQDSKYISLENGVVVDFEMNHACAAGTGSFLEEQSQRLGIEIDEEFADLAFKSESPIKLGERCTVFMESDLLSYQQQGAKREDLVAGLSYSIVSNYLNRVVGRRRIGTNICFQGGTAFNKAVWAAFEMVTGKQIMVPDHHEVTGALGAASIAAERMQRIETEQGMSVESRFRGFENLVTAGYSVESFSCDGCANNCEIKKVQLPSAEPLYYGSRCDRYNLKKKSRKARSFDAFGYRREKLLEFAGLSGDRAAAGKSKGRVGIAMALVGWELLPLFGRFFKALGFEVVLSGWTDKRLIRKGVESVTAQPCFPVKVAYGHIAELIEKKVDYIFLPSIVSMGQGCCWNKSSQLCPYVQSLGYQVLAAFGEKLERTKILADPVYMGQGERLLRKSFSRLGKKLGVSAGAVGGALDEGLAWQSGFGEAIKEKGREILDNISDGQRLFVLVSRPYNGCDEGLNLRLPKKLAELGAEVIPMDMLDIDEGGRDDELLGGKVYWTYGQRILKAARLIRADRRLFAIYLSNFGCGPDSFLLTFFKDVMSPKPCLQLELDEHSADAGIITRLEAFLESLKHYKVCVLPAGPIGKRVVSAKVGSDGRKLYIPYMGDCAYAVAACIRAFGRGAEVMPLADDSVLLLGRGFTSGKECLPCAITAGDMLKVVSSEGFQAERSAFFMPGGAGPCRFGMYNSMHRLILSYAGAGNAAVISPNQDNSFYKEFAESVKGLSVSSFTKYMWTASVGADLLGKVILRLRPMAKEACLAEKVYQRSLKRWVRAVESRRSLLQMRRLMESIAEEFANIELDHEVQKPRIGIVGEIYVRNHPFANNDIIGRVESLGGMCELASVAEWIYYTNFTRINKARRTGRVYDYFTNRIQDYIQYKIEKTLAGPLEERFGRLAEEPIGHVIELARPYLDPCFEGEAILSIGKMVEFHRRGVGGVINVMPFGCMPSTIVSTMTMRLSARCDDMPILNLSFDGQEDPTLETRLEAFLEQAGQRESKKTISNRPMAGLEI